METEEKVALARSVTLAVVVTLAAAGVVIGAGCLTASLWAAATGRHGGYPPQYLALQLAWLLVPLLGGAAVTFAGRAVTHRPAAATLAILWLVAIPAVYVAKQAVTIAAGAPIGVGSAWLHEHFSGPLPGMPSLAWVAAAAAGALPAAALPRLRRGADRRPTRHARDTRGGKQ